MAHYTPTERGLSPRSNLWYRRVRGGYLYWAAQCTGKASGVPCPGWGQASVIHIRYHEVRLLLTRVSAGLWDHPARFLESLPRIYQLGYPHVKPRGYIQD